MKEGTGPHAIGVISDHHSSNSPPGLPYAQPLNVKSASGGPTQVPRWIKDPRCPRANFSNQFQCVISITPLSYALSPGGSVGPPLPTLLPVRAQSYKSSSPGLGCQGPVKVVTYDPDLLAVNRLEVPTNPCSGWLGLLEWLAEFKRMFY